MTDRDVARAIADLLGKAVMRLLREGCEFRDLEAAWYKISLAHPWLSRCYWCGAWADGCDCPPGNRTPRDSKKAQQAG